jgi:hypothetical protein
VPRTARSAKPGSSKSAPASKGGRRQLTNPPSDDSDIEELTAVGNNDTDGEVVEVLPRTKKPPSRAETAINGNGKQSAKGKGKARAVPQKATRKPAPPPELMDVDPIVIDEDEPGPGPSVALAINFSGKNKRPIPPTTRSTKNGEASSVMDQLHRVRTYISCLFRPRGTHGHYIHQAEAQIAALSQQLEEVFQIRETEAEELLRRQEAQYQAQLQGTFALLSS